MARSRGDGLAHIVAFSLFMVFLGALSFVPARMPGGMRAFGKRQMSKTERQYSTETILPSMVWANAGFGSGDLENGEIRTVTVVGLDIAIGKTDTGKLFAVGDKAPPTGVSLSQGGYVEGETVVEPQYGSKFDPFTGDVVEWCTFPPLLGPFIGAFMGVDSVNSALSVNTARVKHLTLMAASTGGNNPGASAAALDYTLDSPMRSSGAGKRLPSLATQRQGMVGLPSLGSAR